MSFFFSHKLVINEHRYFYYTLPTLTKNLFLLSFEKFTRQIRFTCQPNPCCGPPLHLHQMLHCSYSFQNKTKKKKPFFYIIHPINFLKFQKIPTKQIDNFNQKKKRKLIINNL